MLQRVYLDCGLYLVWRLGDARIIELLPHRLPPEDEVPTPEPPPTPKRRLSFNRALQEAPWA